AGVQAEGLGDEAAAQLVGTEADGVGQQRLSGVEVEGQAGRDADAPHRLQRLLRGGGDLWPVGRFVAGVARGQECGEEGGERGGGGGRRGRLCACLYCRGTLRSAVAAGTTGPIL